MRPSLPSLVRLVPIPPPFYVAPSSVKSVGVSGYNHFSTPCRKILFRYHKMQDTHEGLRDYLRTSVIELARTNPHTEIVVRSTQYKKTPVVEAWYTNGRTRSIALGQKRPDWIDIRVNKLINASGNRIIPLRRKQIEAGPLSQSARGMWSGLHIPQPVNI